MKRKIVLYGTVIILAIISGIYNYKTTSDFFEVSLNEILILLMTFFLGTYFVEKNSKEEKTKEKYEKLLDKFENALMDKNMIDSMIKNKKTCDILLRFKKLNNILDILKSKSEELVLKEEIEVLEKDYKEYNDKLSTHITSPSKIDFDDLERLKINIENKCDEIRLKLF